MVSVGRPWSSSSEGVISSPSSRNMPDWASYVRLSMACSMLSFILLLRLLAIMLAR